MGNLAFDTHAFVKQLTAVGMPENQAEVLAANQVSLIDDKLATKQDLKALEMATKRDIKELETSLKRDIADVKRDMKELEARMTIRLGTMMVLAVGGVATLVKLL